MIYLNYVRQIIGYSCNEFAVFSNQLTLFAIKKHPQCLELLFIFRTKTFLLSYFPNRNGLNFWKWATPIPKKSEKQRFKVWGLYKHAYHVQRLVI